MKKPKKFRFQRLLKTKNPAIGEVLHGRSDSNARHLVLETSALPTELHPFLFCECKYNNNFITTYNFQKILPFLEPGKVIEIPVFIYKYHEMTHSYNAHFFSFHRLPKKNMPLLF